ncbi:MAG: hypothetical protein HKN34_05010 [Gammaproteobacteria bacterium]|nr:hypothetical protein [Gammaproteobacteria bacterium]
MERSLSIVVTGRYDGSYGGDSNGNFSVFVDRDGGLYGWAADAFDGHLELTGSASVIDGLVAGNVSSGSTFNGSIDGSGNLTGTWTLPPNESGTFSGSRTVSVSSSIDHDLIAMFAGSWVGTTVSNQGNSSFSATLDDVGNISMPAPNQRVAGAITSTSTSSASFSGLRDDGTEFSGTLTLPDQLNAQFNNSVTGESGTYSATKQ